MGAFEQPAPLQLPKFDSDEFKTFVDISHAMRDYCSRAASADENELYEMLRDLGPRVGLVDGRWTFFIRATIPVEEWGSYHFELSTFHIESGWTTAHGCAAKIISNLFEGWVNLNLPKAPGDREDPQEWARLARLLASELSLLETAVKAEAPVHLKSRLLANPAAHCLHLAAWRSFRKQLESLARKEAEIDLTVITCPFEKNTAEDLQASSEISYWLCDSDEFTEEVDGAFTISSQIWDPSSGPTFFRSYAFRHTDNNLEKFIRLAHESRSLLFSLPAPLARLIWNQRIVASPSAPSALWIEFIFRLAIEVPESPLWRSARCYAWPDGWELRDGDAYMNDIDRDGLEISLESVTGETGEQPLKFWFAELDSLLLKSILAANWIISELTALASKPIFPSQIESYSPTEKVTPKRSSGKPGRKKVQTKSTNELMTKILEKRPDAASWSIRDWAEAIDRSISSIAETSIWSNLQKLREQEKKDFNSRQQVRRNGGKADSSESV